MLEGICETGSIAAVGRRMGMSYKGAWHLIDILNKAFVEPPATARKGGRTGGDALLTPMENAILEGYLRMERLG